MALFLGALAALGLPLILWLHRRALRPTTTHVASLQPWLAVARRRAPKRQRLEAGLLLALRMAAAGLLAAAIALSGADSAGPVARSGGTVTVLLDTTGSMAAASRWLQALAVVREISVAAAGDVSLVSVGPRSRVLAARERSASRVLAATHGVLPAGEGGDLDRALALAAALDPTARLYFVTDGGPGLSVSDAPRVRSDVSVRLIGEPMANRAIVGVELATVDETDGAGHGTRRELRVTVARFGQVGPEASLDLVVDGAPHDRQRLDIPSAGAVQVTWRLPRSARVAEARLEPADAHPADDVVLLGVPGVVQNVQFVGESPAALRALAALDGVVIARAGLGSLNPGGARSLVAFAGQDPPADLASGRLVFNPTPGGAMAPAVGPPREIVLEAAGPSPLLAGLDLAGATVSGARVPSAPRWAEEVLAAGGRALVYLGVPPGGGGRTAVLAFDSDSGDLRLREAFPALVARAAAWARGEPEARFGPSVAIGYGADPSEGGRSSEGADALAPAGARSPGGSDLLPASRGSTAPGEYRLSGSMLESDLRRDPAWAAWALDGAEASESAAWSKRVPAAPTSIMAAAAAAVVILTESAFRVSRARQRERPSATASASLERSRWTG